ncbi:hypothetical protein JCM3774_003415 [Rhodotorula dairenensis]
MLPRTKDRLLVRRPLNPRPSTGSLYTNGHDSSAPHYLHQPPQPTRRALRSLPPLARRRLALAVVLLAVAGALFALWSLAAKWSFATARTRQPRKKLDYRWWQVDEPPPDDLAALLPKPDIPPLLPPPPIPPGQSLNKAQQWPQHTYAELLRLPSTFTTTTTTTARQLVTWTAVVHLSRSSSVSPANLSPLLGALAAQTPLPPARIVLLLPRSVRPPSDQILAPFERDRHRLGGGGPPGGGVAIVAYSDPRPRGGRRGSAAALRPERDHAAFMALIKAASTGEIDTDYLLFVDDDDGSDESDGDDGDDDDIAREEGTYLRSIAGMLRGDGAAEGGYVRALLHASGTSAYAASLLSAGGLALAPASTSHESLDSSATSSSSFADLEARDQCLFPLRDPPPSSSFSRRPVSAHSTTERISIPTTPFLAPVSWFVPRDPSDPTHTSIVQGIPPSSRLGLVAGIKGTVAAAVWTKHAIPAYALPLLVPPALPLSSSSSSLSDEAAAAAAAAIVERTSVATAQGDGKDGVVTATSRNVRELFGPRFGAGEGLRLSRLSGDRARGGGGGGGSGGSQNDHDDDDDDDEGEEVGSVVKGTGRKQNKSPLERAEEVKSDLLQTGTVVILVSGEDELSAVWNLACRFAAQGVGRREPDRGRGPRQGQHDEEEEQDGGDDGGQEDDRRSRPWIRRDLKIVVADLDLTTWTGPTNRGRTTTNNDDDEEAGDATSSTAACHLDLTPLRGGTLTSGSDGAAISVPLLDLFESLVDPHLAFVLYMTDSPRAREFEEVLRWAGGYFGPKQGQARLSRVRAERTMLRGAGGRGETTRVRPTVVGMPREEVKRAEWIGALSLEALRHFHTPRIDISVVTNNRPVSLHRLLTSLRTAHYYGDDVSLSIHLEQTADRLTHRLVDDLDWAHGPLSVRHRILLGGLMPAIVESWYPTSNDTYGVLLEDDVEVSPLFYGWLKFAILHYRYTLAGRKASPRLFGVSLYQQKNIELRPEGRQPFDAHALFRDLSLSPTTPYLSQIPCSWGAAYFPEQWREFHSYLALRLSELALSVSEPIVPEIRSNRWPRSWKKYFIELVYLRGYTMLYPNYPGFESLSTNHLEVGTHVHTAVEMKKKALFEVPLLPRTASLVDSLPGPPGLETLPAWESLPIIDLWGSLATAEELVERGWQTTRMIGSCGATRLPSLAPHHLAHPRYDAHELLCRRVWDRETEGRLVDAQPLRDIGTGDGDLLPHPGQYGAKADLDLLQDAPSDGRDRAADQDLIGAAAGRRTVELAEPVPGHDGDNKDDDDVPTIARLDILPTEIRDDDDETSVLRPPEPAR